MASDKHPQILRLHVTESAINTFTQVAVPTGLPQVPAKGKVLAMNLLFILASLSVGAGGDLDGFSSQLTTKSESELVDLNSQGVICTFNHQTIVAAAGSVRYTQPIQFILHDGKGHGPLIVTPEIYIGIKGNSQVAVGTANFALYYTMVEVDAVEVLGIAQAG
jgi:hypothetical protein